MKSEEFFMAEAIRLSRQGMLNNEGGPFGCIIVKDGVIVGRGNNKVIELNDPTAHAEVVAIRDACKQLGNYQLSDCEVYTTCEPCPMCMGALYWARPKKIYYANTRTDAAAIGFDDSLIYNELAKEMEERKIPMIAMERSEAIKVFDEWKLKGDKSLY